jgi:hypothetical protein
MASVRVMKGLVAVLLLGVCGLVKAQQIADFEDLALETGSYWNGSDGSGGFASGSTRFNNYYDSGYWDGFAYSNRTDIVSMGMDGQYNVIAGCGQGGSANYAVGFIGFYGTPPTMVLDEPTIVSGLYVTNNNYAYYSMLYGDAFAKKFGSDDWFLLTITGRDAWGNVTDTVPFYLANFLDGKSEIVNDWQYVNLASLGVVKSVEFGLSSSDTAPWGMNTPGYFVIDTVVPEPATFMLLGIGALVIKKKR